MTQKSKYNYIKSFIIFESKVPTRHAYRLEEKKQRKVDEFKRQPGYNFYKYFMMGRNQVVSQKEMLRMIPRFLAYQEQFKNIKIHT